MESLELRVAPWPDFVGNSIHEGDTIVHPDGTRGRVVILSEHQDPGDAWRVDYGTGDVSRLCLQIGDKGQAVVERPQARAMRAALIARRTAEYWKAERNAANREIERLQEVLKRIDRLLMRAQKQLTRYSSEDPMAEEIASYFDTRLQGEVSCQ